MIDALPIHASANHYVYVVGVVIVLLIPAHMMYIVIYVVGVVFARDVEHHHEVSMNIHEKNQLIKFQEFLEKEWPLWRPHEGGVMYSALWRAFIAGCNSK